MPKKETVELGKCALVNLDKARPVWITFRPLVLMKIDTIQISYDTTNQELEAPDVGPIRFGTKAIDACPESEKLVSNPQTFDVEESI